MLEAALVFDKEGRTLHWHLPPGRSGGSIPDSRGLWQVMWQHRHELGGVAHTHPWSGRPEPSSIDLTTWSACERGLGVRLLWPIATHDQVAVYRWAGPRELEYQRVESSLEIQDLEELRRKSNEEDNHG